MEYFRKIRDYVLGEDISIGEASKSGSSAAPRAAELQAAAAKQAPQQQRQRPQGQRDAFPAVDEVTSAPLARGPGVLRDVDGGASGGVQGLSWYRARLQQDADGDVAEQFLSESTSQPTAGGKPIGQPEHSVEVQRKRLRRPKTGSMRVEEGNVRIEVCEEPKQ